MFSMPCELKITAKWNLSSEDIVSKIKFEHIEYDEIKTDYQYFIPVHKDILDIRVNPTRDVYPGKKTTKTIELKVFSYSSPMDDLITVLDFHHNINITDLLISRCCLSLINIDGLTKLKYLEANYNNIKQINLSANVSLVTILLGNNKLTSFTTPNAPNLLHLLVNDNKITSLSSFNIKGLSTFDCTHNNLPKAECDRIIALGYKEYFVNPQNDNI